MRISPGEELARVEALTKLAEEGVASRRFAVAVSGLSNLVERGSDAKVRDYAIWGLMNTLLSEPKCVNDGSIRVIVRAIGDKDEAVSITAETAALVLAKDFVGRAFPILLEEIQGADERTSERLISTVRTICQLATPRERDKLDAIVRKHGVDLMRGRNDGNVVRLVPPKRAPEKLLRKTG